MLQYASLEADWLFFKKRKSVLKFKETNGPFGEASPRQWSDDQLPSLFFGCINIDELLCVPDKARQKCSFFQEGEKIRLTSFNVNNTEIMIRWFTSLTKSRSKCLAEKYETSAFFIRIENFRCYCFWPGK